MEVNTKTEYDKLELKIKSNKSLRDKLLIKETEK